MYNNQLRRLKGEVKELEGRLREKNREIAVVKLTLETLRAKIKT